MFSSNERAFNLRFDRSNLCNVPRFRSIQAANDNCRGTRYALAIVMRFIASQLFVTFLCLYSITRARLIIVVSLGGRFTCVFCHLRFVVSDRASPVIAVIVVTNVNDLILAIRNDGGFDELCARVYRAVLRRESISTLQALSVRVCPICPFRFTSFALGRFNVIQRLAVERAVANRDMGRAMRVPRVIFCGKDASSFKR